MQAREDGRWRLGWAAPVGWGLGALVCLLAGCAANRSQVHQAMKVGPERPAPREGVTDKYQVRCPDVLDVAVAGRPDGGRLTVGPDGRVELAGLGRVRVEGQTPAEVARTLAAALGVPPDSVRVRVVEYRSQHVYLYGEVFGLHRAVPYQGPETVLELLQRVGGITPGAADGDVHVIRSHVADGRAPEVFHIDLRAIVLGKDQSTNLRLQPFDQVYVGQARQAVVEKCVPPWFRPVYRKMTHGVGVAPDDRVTR